MAALNRPYTTVKTSTALRLRSMVLPLCADRRVRMNHMANLSRVVTPNSRNGADNERCVARRLLLPTPITQPGLILTSGLQPEGPGASAAVKADLIDPWFRKTAQRTPHLKAVY